MWHMVTDGKVAVGERAFGRDEFGEPCNRAWKFQGIQQFLVERGR